jgi:hypothetical protein
MTAFVLCMSYMAVSYLLTANLLRHRYTRLGPRAQHLLATKPWATLIWLSLTLPVVYLWTIIALIFTKD